MGRPRINLIKDMVPSPGQRRRQYVFLVTYLALCGIAAVLVINASTKMLLRAFEQQRIVTHLENIHAQKQPGSPGMVPFADEAVERLKELSVQMELIREVTDQHAFPATIMFNLVNDLPGGAFISSLNLDQEERLVQFELNVPARPGESSADPDKFIALWSSRPDLSAILDELSAVRTERQRIERNYFFVMLFTGTIKELGP